MRSSATFSRIPRPGGWLPVLLLGAGLFPSLAGAKVFLTVEEAVKLAFPGCEVSRQTSYLTSEQQQRVKALSGEEMPSALVTSYHATRAGRPAGIAYFDTHLVRTLPETLMVVVGPDGRVARLEVISFREPEEYLPRPAWYEQFLGRGLDPELNLKRGIHPVSGASLTARATTGAIRRVLALDQVLGGARNPAAASPPSAPPAPPLAQRPGPPPRQGTGQAPPASPPAARPGS